MNVIIGILAKIKGVDFFIQYFSAKILDNVLENKGRLLKKGNLYLAFFSAVLEKLCEKNGWEYDDNAVETVFCDEVDLLRKMETQDDINEVLIKLLGNNYADNYTGDLSKQWVECVKECVLQPEFEIIWKEFIVDGIESTNNSLSEIKHEIKVSNAKFEEMKDAAIRNDRHLINDDCTVEFKIAMDEIDNEEYESAIKRLKKVNIWTKDKQLKFISYNKLGFCCSKLDDIRGYEQALRWFLKAQKICDYEKDDASWLFRNIAILYIYLGERENKVENYKLSNEYFEKVLEYMKEEDKLLYYYDALIHIGRNCMDMCDELPVKDVPIYLEIAELIMLFVYNDEECKLTEEMIYVLVYNLGRLYYHKAEKIDFKYIKNAQELYIYVLKMKYVRNNQEILAMVNINTGLSFYVDTENKLDNANKAIEYYDIGISLYEGIERIEFKRSILSAKLNLASAYKTIYQIKHDESMLKESLKLIEELDKSVKYTSLNSLYIRVNLLRLELCIEASKHGCDLRDFDDITRICNKLNTMSKQVGYEKYQYIYQLLNYEVKLLTETNMSIQEREKVREELLQIQADTKEGNSNISEKAEELIEKYCFAVDEMNK